MSAGPLCRRILAARLRAAFSRADRCACVRPPGLICSGRIDFSCACDPKQCPEVRQLKEQGVKPKEALGSCWAFEMQPAEGGKTCISLSLAGLAVMAGKQLPPLAAAAAAAAMPQRRLAQQQAPLVGGAEPPSLFRVAAPREGQLHAEPLLFELVASEEEEGAGPQLVPAGATTAAGPPGAAPAAALHQAPLDAETMAVINLLPDR